MRAEDLLTSFLEASLTTGQWEAALLAFQAAEDAQQTERNTTLLCRVQARAGHWRHCVQLCDMHDRDKRNLKLVRIAASSCCRHQQWEYAVKLCSRLSEHRRLLLDDEGKQLSFTVSVVNHVISCMPKEAKLEAPQVMQNVRQFERWLREGSTNRWWSQQEHHQTHGGGEQRGATTTTTVSPRDVKELNFHLTKILRSINEPNHMFGCWRHAIQLFCRAETEKHQSPLSENCQSRLSAGPNAVSQNILIQILGKKRRDAELLRLLDTTTIPSTETTLKTLGEAAVDCKSWRLGLAVLSPKYAIPSPTLSHSLSQQHAAASAIVPALIALRMNKSAWVYALRWWTEMSPNSPLRGNQRVSSYVAQQVCLVTHRYCGLPQVSSHTVPACSWAWETALTIIASTAHVHPARAVLFGVDAMRVAHCWVKAIELYHRHRAELVKTGPEELTSITRVLTQPGAKRWIPKDVVHTVVPYGGRWW